MSVYVGIDVHRKRSQVAVVTEDGQVHPAPVMDQQPPRGQRPRQPRGQAGVVRQRPDQCQPGMRHDSVPPAVTCSPFNQPVVFTV